jgi:hypothetical protein
MALYTQIYELWENFFFGNGYISWLEGLSARFNAYPWLNTFVFNLGADLPTIMTILSFVWVFWLFGLIIYFFYHLIDALRPTTQPSSPIEDDLSASGGRRKPYKGRTGRFKKR